MLSGLAEADDCEPPTVRKTMLPCASVTVVMISPWGPTDVDVVSADDVEEDEDDDWFVEEVLPPVDDVPRRDEIPDIMWPVTFLIRSSVRHLARHSLMFF
ncbi:hypothetical protein AA103196_1972 [Ameyamaea chiangmaiensis NBRC 103196]|nr:hypothetical protein AA103196_1972 [Ameyamaea chiangmaiensis NBRC 103196]